MISKDNLIKIGTLSRTHGTKGEVQLNLVRDFAEDAEFLMVLIDELAVPFYLEDWRYKTNDNVLLKFEDINSDEAAKQMIGKDVLVEKTVYTDYQEQQMSLEEFVGYVVVDAKRGMLGTINDIDESTINALLQLDTGIIVPLHENLIVSIDARKKELLMSLPEGLVD